MNYIEQYFSSESPEKSDIQGLIDSEIEESYNLEYKQSDSYSNRISIAKQISAFSNASGGLLIIGIREEDHKPVEITWLNAQTESKERLEQIIMSNIQPVVQPSIRIYPVYNTDNNDEVIYLIDIPQSETPPHMAAPQKKYYIRNNFQSVAIGHALVEALFEKRNKPVLEPDFELEYLNQTTIKIRIYLRNIGKVIAKNILFRLYLPVFFDRNNSNLSLQPFGEHAPLDFRWTRGDIYGENEDFRCWNFINNRDIFHREIRYLLTEFELTGNFQNFPPLYSAVLCEDTLASKYVMRISGLRQRMNISSYQVSVSSSFPDQSI